MEPLLTSVTVEYWGGRSTFSEDMHGSYVRLVDSCITQLKAQGPSRTCDESKEEEDARQGRGQDATCCQSVRREMEGGREREREKERKRERERKTERVCVCV